MGNHQYLEYKEYPQAPMSDPLYWYEQENTLFAEVLNDVQSGCMAGLPPTIHGYKTTKNGDKLYPASTFAVLRRCYYRTGNMSLQIATKLMQYGMCSDWSKMDVHGVSNYDDYDLNRSRNIDAVLALPYKNHLLCVLSKLGCNIRYESVPDIATAAYAFEKMNTKIECVIMRQMPGPQHWGGEEGGCLGLPKDVAKMILKWL